MRPSAGTKVNDVCSDREVNASRKKVNDMAAMATGFNSNQQPDENCQVQEMNVTAYKSVFHRAKKTSRKLRFYVTFDVFEGNLHFKTVFLYCLRMTQLTLMLDFCKAEQKSRNIYKIKKANMLKCKGK